MDIEKVQVGINKYRWIMKWIHETDVSTDVDFQRFYNGFYRIRQRPASFYKTFYAYLEKNKYNGQLSFEDVLIHFYHETGTIQASFSSKLLATVRPDMPIWDKFVLQNLGLRPPYSYQKDRIEKTLALYQKICNWYQSGQAHEKLQEFNDHFPGVNISDVKKIDFILWSTR